MTVQSEIVFQPGQAAWVYLTFTNPDSIDPTVNPFGLVDADPVICTILDVSGGLATAAATHLSLGYYRVMVQFQQGGGSYVVHAAGSGLGTATEEVVIRVGRGIV